MQATATIKYIRISTKKVRSIASAMKGLRVNDAMDRLKLSGTKHEMLLAKCIGSAYANFKNKPNSSPEARIKMIETSKGPTLKRFQPVSRGMAHSIKKRTSHIRVTLESIVNPKSEIRNPKKTEKIQKQEKE